MSQIDLSSYHRFTNDFLGEGRALDVRSDGSRLLAMSPTGRHSGQLWRLVPLGGLDFALRTHYLGDCYSLDIVNDGDDDTPIMAPTGDVSGQRWRMIPWGDGTVRLTNAFTGPDRSLDVFSDTHRPFVGPGDHSGQHWTMTPVEKIPAVSPVPGLVDGPDDEQSDETPTDFSLYARPEGRLHAVMIFVDFPDARVRRTPSPDQVARHLLGDGAAQELFDDQSYGTMTLDVSVRSNLGWRRMPEPSTDYSFVTFESHRRYLTDVAALFSRREVDLAAADFVFVVAPEAAAFPLSPAFTAHPGAGAPTSGGEIRLAVTFGSDSYRNRFTNLVHEVGHLVGLPDLYSYSGGGATTSKAGAWALMSDIFHATGFLGWHRHKNGWLPPERANYLDTDDLFPWHGTIHALSGDCGQSMVVVPVDDRESPSKVFVVELAQPIRGTGAAEGERRGEGVLLYTVDGTLATGQSPVVVLPKTVSASPEFGNLPEAPYQVGEADTHTVDGVTVKIEVLQRFGESYNVRIEVER